MRQSQFVLCVGSTSASKRLRQNGHCKRSFAVGFAFLGASDDPEDGEDSFVSTFLALYFFGCDEFEVEDDVLPDDLSRAATCVPGSCDVLLKLLNIFFLRQFSRR